jgi:hypothetical protein
MNQTETTLAEVFGRALETLAFVSPLPEPRDCAAPAEPLLIRIAFCGSDFGAFEMVAGRAFGMMLAANLMAVDPECPEAGPTAALAEDAMREVCNITCGLLLSQSALDGKPPAELGLPLVLPFDAAFGWEEFISNPASLVFTAEGHSVAICIRGAA